MPNAVEFLKLVKRAAVEAVEASKPVNVCYGKVTNDSPLEILVDQKITLNKNQLVLARDVTEYETDITIDWESELSLSTHTHTVNVVGSDSDGDSINISVESEPTDLAHIHKAIGRKKIIVHNQLVVGDEVILIRQQDGQKYIVVDRIG